jgi:LysM repeat protein
MDRAEERPPLSLLGGSQLRLGLMEEGKKETLFEDLRAFTGLFPIYLFRRVRSVLAVLFRAVFSGFVLTEQLKSWLARLFIRRKGQLSFPVAHATLVGVSLTVLVTTAVLGGVIFKKPKTIASINPFILESSTELNTELSEIGSTKAATHEVKEGEDIYSIAQFYIRTVDDLVSANPTDISESQDKDGAIIYKVKVGTVLAIPPINGRDYVIQPGDTLEEIARRFGSNAQQIAELNYIFSPDNLYKYISTNKDLYPGGKIIVPMPRTYTAGIFTIPSGTCKKVDLGWPTSGGYTDKIGDYTYGHRGVDFAASYGEKLYAVADGTVSAVSNFSRPCFRFDKSCNYGYGGFVFIDIGDGLQARYGHISRPLVGAGEPVVKDQVIAEAGDSGVAFGPHLHFEIYCGGVHQRVNPLIYLE